MSSETLKSCVWLLCVSSMLFFHSCAATDAARKDVSRLIPLNQGVRGWTKDGDIIVCNNLAELTRQINGGAPFYIERGAVKAVFQEFENANKDVYINIEIYQMENHDQAEKLFDDVFVDRPDFLSDIGEKARMANYLIGVYSIDFIKDNFYARLTVTGKSNESRIELENFADIISEKIQ